MVYNWLDTVCSALFPARCALCGAAADRELCAACHADLPHNRHACRCCAIPLPADAGEDALCGPCQQHPPPYTACLAALRYQAPLDRLVTGLKFHGRLAHGRLLAELLGDYLETRGFTRPDLLVPVPLHPARLRRRGYNQALELARPLSKRFDLTLDVDALRRRRDTQPQMELDHRQRLRNMRGAFEAGAQVRDRHVAVVDDVVTTGHTVEEAAKALLRAGAARIDVWACARTPTTHHG